MRYLGLALYAEGPTDYRFLRPILLRLCSDLCVRESRKLVEINDDVLALDHPRHFQSASREDRILEAARQARGAWSILFIHADAGNDAARARQQQVLPAIGRLGTEFSENELGVAVVPIRETEAWAVCDGDALRQVFGTSLNDEAMGIPGSANATENMGDPKQCLRRAFSLALPRSRRRKVPRVEQMLNALGEQISLDRLRKLSAFVALENELRQALRDAQFLD